MSLVNFPYYPDQMKFLTMLFTLMDNTAWNYWPNLGVSHVHTYCWAPGDYHWRVPFSTASKKSEREKTFTTSLSIQLSPSLTDLNLKYNISNTWKTWALLKVFSVLFVLWCSFSQTLCKNQGTTSALRSLKELLKTELLLKTRQKKSKPWDSEEIYCTVFKDGEIFHNSTAA